MEYLVYAIFVGFVLLLIVAGISKSKSKQDEIEAYGEEDGELSTPLLGSLLPELEEVAIVPVVAPGEVVKVVEVAMPKPKKVVKPRLTRKVYHVVPHKDGGWQVNLKGKKDGEHFNLKTKAITGAKKLAMAAEKGQVVVHKKDGTIQYEYTYGDDPKTKG